MREIRMKSGIPLLLALALLAGCSPDSGFNSISDYDVVVTNFDPEADFQVYTTFAVADTLLELGRPEGDDTPLPEWLKDLIRDEIIAQMEKLNYTFEPDPVSNGPDVIIVAGITQTRWTGYVPGYPWYPGWGWGPWYPWYPWYPGGGPGYKYQYDTGSIIIDYADFGTYDPDTDEIEIRWTAGMNGLISSSSSSNQERIIRGIRQAFEQSPYLKKN